MKLDHMTTMSDLPGDLVGETLSKVPMPSLRLVRSTCKKWNDLSTNRIFGKAAARKQFLGFMMKDSRVCSLRFDLQGIRKEDKDFVDNPSIKQVSILNQVEIYKIFHCHGLCLCITKDKSSLVVWNPYLGQTRCIQPGNGFNRSDVYALGYDKNNCNHKILRFLDIDFCSLDEEHLVGHEIYDFRSNSWRVLDVTPDWEIDCCQRGVALKGNTYFFAKQRIMDEEGDEIDITETEDFLLCFDFTAERFGPRLPLPFHSYFEETVTLSCVREEQLAVLYQQGKNYFEYTLVMEIWITTNIEPNAVSWSKFLKVEMRPFVDFRFLGQAGSFFIDVEERVAVVFDLDNHHTRRDTYQEAYIIGQDGYFKSVNIGRAPNVEKPKEFGYTSPIYCTPLVCPSYVPSLVQLQINHPGKRKERDDE